MKNDDSNILELSDARTCNQMSPILLVRFICIQTDTNIFLHEYNQQSLIFSVGTVKLPTKLRIFQKDDLHHINPAKLGMQGSLKSSCQNLATSKRAFQSCKFKLHNGDEKRCQMSRKKQNKILKIRRWENQKKAHPFSRK